jgi:hypothetical protein
VVRNIITLLTLGTDLHIMSRYVWRIINPVGQLSRRKHVDEVSAVAGHQDMLARNDHGGNHDVGIALPPAMLASQEQTLGNGTCYIECCLLIYVVQVPQHTDFPKTFFFLIHYRTLF